MKKSSVMKYSRFLFLKLIILFSTQVVIQGQPVSESRTLEKSFSVNEEMSLDVKNKYGKVHLSPTDKDSVFIRIELNVSASKPSKLKKLIDGISFNLTSTNYFVIAETEINKGPVNIIESLRNLTNNLISSDSELEIDYYIAAPSYIDIKIDNRYGDIYIESNEADINLTLNNGNVRCEDLWGETSFDLSFCDATFESLRKSRITVSYGELNIKRAEDVNLNSTSSRIDIKEIEYLKLESKRDKYFITNLSLIDGSSYFSDINIDLLREKVNLSTRYGNLNIELFPRSFDIISVESSYTSVYLNANSDASFSLDAKLSNCSSSIPETWIIEEKTLNAERNEYLYFGSIGNNDPSAKVILKLTRGKLDFRQENE